MRGGGTQEKSCSLIALVLCTVFRDVNEALMATFFLLGFHIFFRGQTRLVFSQHYRIPLECHAFILLVVLFVLWKRSFLPHHRELFTLSQRSPTVAVGTHGKTEEEEGGYRRNIFVEGRSFFSAVRKERAGLESHAQGEKRCVGERVGMRKSSQRS